MNNSGNIWRGWRQDEFQIHFIHTGVAESIFVIFPDSTTMLIDCGDHAAITRIGKSVPVLPGPERLAGEWVARYVRRANPNGADVDWAVVSHFHADHTGTPHWQMGGNYGENPRPLPGCARSGLALAAEQLRFRRATDRGLPGYADPISGLAGEAGICKDFIKALWEALRQRDGLETEPFRLGATDQFVPLRGGVPGFTVRNVCANGRIATPDGSILDLYADYIARNNPANLNENALSLGMEFRYGKFSFVTCGDFSDRISGPCGEEVFIEDALAKAVGHCNVAKTNHHAHHAMGRRLAAALRPQAYVSCVWDQLHCTDDSMESLLVPGAPDAEQPMLIPTVLPTNGNLDSPWRRFVPEACKNGCHIVVTVPPGGETFSIALIDARDETMRLAAEYGFKTT